MNKKLLSVLIVLSAVLFTGCSKKDEVDVRDQFVATYQVTDAWTASGISKTYSYSMIITKSAQDPNVILMSNFGGESGTIVTASVSGNKFTIQQQTVQGYGYSGSGTISGSTLSFSYLISASGGSLVNVSSAGAKM